MLFFSRYGDIGNRLIAGRKMEFFFGVVERGSLDRLSAGKRTKKDFADLVV